MNLRPPDYQSSALPTELREQICGGGQPTFTALAARGLPRPGGFPPLYSVSLHGAAERTRTSEPDELPDHPLSRRADYQLSDCCRLPGRTIFTLFHRRRPHRKPEYPGTRYGCSLAAGVGFEPTGHVSGRRFSGPIGYHYHTLPCGEEGGTRTLKPHLQGSDRLAICCLAIGLTPSFRLQIV